MRAIRALDPRPTCLVITHRRSVVSFCDRVFSLRDGRLAEEAAPHGRMMDALKTD